MVGKLIDLLCDAIAADPSLAQQERILVYPMAPARIGHILRDMFLFGRLFPERPKVVATFRIVRGVNELAFDELTRDMKVIFLDDFAGSLEEAEQLYHPLTLWWHAAAERHMLKHRGLDLVVPLGSDFVTTEYCRRRVQEPGYAPEPVQLRREVLDQGHAFDRRLELDGRRIALLHVRDTQYRANDERNDHRASHIEAYAPLIRHLVSEGYFLIRIGHPRMTPLSQLDLSADDRASVFDAATSGGPFPEVYYAQRCDFLIHSGSGPTEYALLFAKPSLALNVPFSYDLVPRPREMVTYRLYDASLDELLAAGVPLPEPGQRIPSVENDPELLRDSGAEFLAFMAATATLGPSEWTAMYELPYARVRTLDRILARHKAANPERAFYPFNDFIPHRAVVSNAFLDRSRWL
jgi:hypothetical protein